MRKGGWGRVKLGKERVFTLSYADDMLMAEEENDMKAMISRLERLDRRLELNAGKTKVMRLREREGRIKKIDWKWKEKKLEEVKEYKYLGYTIQRNGGQEAHVREKRRKAAAVIRKVWGIKKRIWSKDWEKH